MRTQRLDGLPESLFHHCSERPTSAFGTKGMPLTVSCRRSILLCFPLRIGGRRRCSQCAYRRRSDAAVNASEISEDLRCVRCGCEDLHATPDAAPGTYVCRECAARYEPIFGIPYFGAYEEEDILSLIEVAANLANRGRFGVTPASVERLEEVAAAYHQAEDKEAFVSTCPDAQAPYFMNRYGEWVEITHLTRDLDLQGLKVLDLGAGLGFDSHRLAMRGAKVTALEFSPLLGESGQASFPHIRWIGGFSHCLPFKSASFDMVFANAALHHMRDLPAAISKPCVSCGPEACSSPLAIRSGPAMRATKWN
jgi:hypothetical protein